MKQNNGVYDLRGKQLVVFSDEEGGNPFWKDRRKDSQGSNDPIGLVCEDGLVTDVRAGTGLAFLGDVQDNAAYSIRLMQRFLDMKLRKPDTVILIAGNRDVNKVRWADEAYITPKASKGTLWKYIQDQRLNTFIDIVQHVAENIQKGSLEWKFSSKQLVPVMDIPQWSNLADKAGLFDSRNSDNGFEDICRKTFGANDAVELMCSELQALNLMHSSNNGRSVTRWEKNVAFALMSMVMSRVWKSDSLPKVLSGYNGLYLKYLAACDLCAHVTTDHGVAFVSHSGYNDAFHRIYNFVGMSYHGTTDATSVTQLEDVVRSMNALWHQAVGAMQGFSSDVMFRSTSQVQHAIHMSADSGEHITNSNGVRFNSRASVIAQPAGVFQDPRDRRHTNTHMVYKTKNTRGGGQAPSKQEPRLTWQTAVLTSQKIKYFNLYQDAPSSVHGSVVRFNIYGHQPRGMAPIVQEVNGTYHIDMDVSKIEGQANNYSYALLVIPPIHANKEPYVKGRALLTVNNTNNEYYLERGCPWSALMQVSIGGKGLELKYEHSLTDMDALQRQVLKQVVAQIVTPTGGTNSVLVGYMLDMQQKLTNMYFLCSPTSKLLDYDDTVDQLHMSNSHDQKVVNSIKFNSVVLRDYLSRLKFGAENAFVYVGQGSPALYR